MSDKEDDVSLRDEISAAFNSDNAKTSEVSNESVIDKLEERPRDESGKFAKKEEAAPEKPEAAPEKPAAEEAPAEEPGVKLTAEKAPSSWSPKVRERWSEIPEEVRSEIIRREEASVNGVRKLQEEYAPIQRFVEQLSPFIQEATQLGQDPTGYIASVMVAERQLRAPSQEARFNALLSIADTYGIPLREIINQSAGQEILKATQQQPSVHPAVAQELEAMRRWREEQESSNLETQINMFKQGKEFFQDVRNTMADLMDSGIAKTLDEAYEKACRLHPEVYDVILSREKSGSSQEQLKLRQAAAAGASVKSSGQAEVDVDSGDEDSLEATVRRAMKEASGRV